LVCACIAAAAPPPTHPTNHAQGGAGCPSPSTEQAPDWPGQHQWRALERAEYRLGQINIDTADVYVGRELPLYQRLANTLHIDTRAGVVRSLVALETGDAITSEAVYRDERRLRSQSFATDAQIVPIRCDDGVVDTAVRVRDAWTLKVSASYSTAGGDTQVGAGFEDANFLGTATSVLVDWRETPERTKLELGYEDPALLGSNWTLDIGYSELSDGREHALGLAYPFRSPSQEWALSAKVDAGTRELSFDQSGDTAYRATIDRDNQRYEVQRLTTLSADSGWRAGAGWRRLRHDYGTLEAEEPALRPAPVLDDLDLQGPYAVLERFSERYRSLRNLRSVGRTRDYALGLSTRLELGRYADGLGDTDPWFSRVRLDYGVALGNRELLLASAGAEGRYRRDGTWHAHKRDAEMSYYYGTSARNTWVVHGELDWRDNLAPADELYLGGFDGLRAYPDRFRVGDSRWLLHLEDRYVSDIVLFDTIQLGYTGYLEAGNIRGLDGEWEETLANVGTGLRAGSLRSSFGSTFYLTVAVPLVDAGDQREYSVVLGSSIDF
jgi:hypothetical protein